MYRETRKQYATLPKSAAFETIHIARTIAVSKHMKEDVLMFCYQTVCVEMAIFIAASFFILCMTDTDDVALLELQVAVLLILYLRFC